MVCVSPSTPPLEFVFFCEPPHCQQVAQSLAVALSAFGEVHRPTSRQL